MSSDPQLLRRIDALCDKIEKLGEKALKPEQKKQADYAANYLQCLFDTVQRRDPVFGIEPWHPLDADEAHAPGEMLLRVKDAEGNPLSPYPAVMTFYHNGFTSDLDIILCLCAMTQYRSGDDRQVSINISGRSLQDPAFLKAVIAHMETLGLRDGERILFEIHESNAVVKLNKNTLDMFKNLGVGFAIDDVGLSMNDVFRLSSFENIADYIKLDRSSIVAHPDDPKSLSHILALAKSLLPDAHMVAEGIRSADHAKEILKMHPNIRFVQGMHLPDRETFAKEWSALDGRAVPDKKNSLQSRLDEGAE